MCFHAACLTAARRADNPIAQGSAPLYPRCGTLMVCAKSQVGAAMVDDAQELELSPDAEDEGEAYRLNKKAVASILYAVEIDDAAKLTELMEPLHAADIADLLEQISAFERTKLIRLYDREFDGEILSELDESIREEVVAILTPEVLSDAVRDIVDPIRQACRAGDSLRDNLDRIEAWLIQRALEQHGGRRAASAKKLGITREGLYKKMKRLGIG